MKYIIFSILFVTSLVSNSQAKQQEECRIRLFYYQLGGQLDGDPPLLSGVLAEYYITVSGWAMIQHKDEDPIEFDEDKALALYPKFTGIVRSMTLDAAKEKKQEDVDKGLKEYKKKECETKQCNKENE